jgi:hypothetical protein
MKAAFLSLSKGDAFAPALEFISQTSVTPRCLLLLGRMRLKGDRQLWGLWVLMGHWEKHRHEGLTITILRAGGRDEK